MLYVWDTCQCILSRTLVGGISNWELGVLGISDNVSNHDPSHSKCSIWFIRFSEFWILAHMKSHVGLLNSQNSSILPARVGLSIWNSTFFFFVVGGVEFSRTIKKKIWTRKCQFDVVTILDQVPDQFRVNFEVRYSSQWNHKIQKLKMQEDWISAIVDTTWFPAKIAALSQWLQKFSHLHPFPSNIITIIKVLSRLSSYSMY